MRMIIRSLVARGCIALFMLLIPLILFSQILPFESISIKDGLASNDVGVIYQDSRGFIWFGTSEGISVYDGYTFTNYNVSDGLPNNFINDIFEDRKVSGVMWILTRGQVARFANHRFKVFTLPVSRVHSVYQDKDGVVWCAGGNAVVTIDGEIVRKDSSGLLLHGAGAVTETADGVLWFVVDNKLVSYSKREGEGKVIDLSFYGDGEITSLMPDREGNLWVSMLAQGNPILQIRDKKVIAMRTFSASTAWLTIDQEKNLWFGGYNGVGSVSIGDFSSAEPFLLTTENGLHENTIRSIFVDHEGNLWLGGRDKGVAKLPATHIVRIPVGTLWLDYQRRFAATDLTGHLWLIQNFELTEFWNTSTGAVRSHQHRLIRDNNPSKGKSQFGSIVIDSNNQLWLTELGKEYVIRHYSISKRFSDKELNENASILKHISTLIIPVPKDSGWPITFIVSRAGDIWLSEGSYGIVRIDPRRTNKLLRVYNQKDGVTINYTREISEDANGNIWAGTYSSGVVRIAPDGSVKNFTTSNGLPDNSIWALLQDRNGNMMVGTSGGGLAEINGDSIAVYSQRTGLPSNGILSMTSDDKGRIWLGTNIGMLYEDPPGSRQFIRHPAFTTSGVNFVSSTKNNLLWFVTGKDVFFYENFLDRTSQWNPPVYITGIKVNGIRRDEVDDLSLSHTENNFEVDFAGINFDNNQSMRYRFRLKSAEIDWQPPTSNRSVTYGHLDPGSYIFEVKAVTVRGVESEQTASLAITILPPYWQTGWFYFGCVVSVVVALAGVFSWRTNQIRKDQQLSESYARQLLASQESERKRVARELHDNLGQELIIIANRARKGLKIATEDQTKNQFDLISKGASGALDSVREIAYDLSPYHLDQVGLAGSIKGMVEKVTTSSDIRFQLTIDDIPATFPKDVEIHLYRIIQECVNNIVKHSQGTEASIGIQLSGRVLAVEVGDNGKGFNVKTEGRASKSRGGFGLKGLAERVKLLNGTLSIDSSPEKGTKVQITIPLGKDGPGAHHNGSSQGRAT